ncbi:Retrovirus-related Pol polyprotein like [Argiope bruennichi]|uniref:RNA-directed DNA polymerase n=1 Tax=Argiope bruennichi TaxID=94029 RepID=A0A8T0FKY4_ARGBR|nr:Retrovirus-related Pol polyprotein like [Argiope bruennichi]
MLGGNGREVTYLGHIISAEGVRTDPDKISAVRHKTCPTDVHQLRSYLGLCTYYRKFVKNFSIIARPLHKLTEAKQKFIWTDEYDNAFNKLKDALTSAPVLAYPEIGKQFILDTDAGHECIGAVLSQEIDGQDRCHRLFQVEKKFGMVDPVVHQVTTPSTSESDPWSDKSVRKVQLADPEIKPIIEFKESTGGKPSWQDIASFHPTTKRYWALWDSLHLRNGVLYRKWESDDGKAFRWQLILPKTRVLTVLKELHGSPTGGHFGVTKTLQKVRKRFYWNNVRNEVEKWCRTCDPCAADKGPGKRIKGRLQLYNVGATFERIAFDILGPLPRSSDGNNNILVVMDYYTKWPEAYPIPDQEAPTVAEILVQNWISRYGVPLQLQSDQGRNLDSAVCRRLCEIFGIDKTHTTALHPQSDDMTTGYSPSQMLFGRNLRLPADLLFSRPTDAPLAPEEYVENLRTRMEEVHHLARDKIGMTSEKMKTRYDARATGQNFHEIDQVWLWNPKRRKGLSPKLQTN